MKGYFFMRKTKDIDVGGTRMTIKELTVFEIREIFSDSGKKTTIQIIDLALQKIAGVSSKQLENFTASEILQLLQEVKEMHSVFFEIPGFLKQIGLEAIWEQVKKNFQEAVNSVLVSVSPQGNSPEKT